MKIFITGATGFVGSHLCELLEKSGHEIFCLARSKKKFQEFSVPGKLILGHLKPSGQHQWLDQLPDDLDAIVHTAGIVHSFDEDNFYQINTQATENLINDLQKKYSKLHFLLISSLSAAGPAIATQTILECDPPTPITHHGKSKLASEKLLNNNSPKEWRKTIIRPPMVIGPRDPAILDIFKMTKMGIALLAGENALTNNYSFVCVHDLVNVIHNALLKPSKELEIYYSSHPNTVTFEELINKIHAKIDNGKKLKKIEMPITLLKIVSHMLKMVVKLYPIEIRLTPDKIPELSAAAWLCSGKKSVEKLDMLYQWDIDQTIAITYEDYVKREWL